jgi:hypothetical protein
LSTFDARIMRDELNWVVTAAIAVRAEADARVAPRRTEIRRELVVYVRQTTNQFHDEQVSALIAGVEDQPNYSGDAHKQWRSRQPSVPQLLAGSSEGKGDSGSIGRAGINGRAAAPSGNRQA